jgi:UDP-GlcNAc:undecaprenyl-phosphate GlcNAc-1-phosphate transferase
MLTAALVFVASAVAAAAFTPVVRDVASRRGAYDLVVNTRQIHARPVPRVGGLAIVAAFVGPLLALLAFHPASRAALASTPWELAAVVVGGLVVAALGLYDDLRGANAKLKLLVQFTVAAGVYAAGFRVDAISHPFGAPIHLGFLGLPFTMLWIAGVVNAMNLIDGLDGLAGGVAFIAVASLFVIGAARGEAAVVLVMAALGGAVLGFLLYNFNPASIFMGDSGSMFLGFVLATVAIQPHRAQPHTVSFLVPVLVLGLPIADTLLAMGRRALRGQPVFSADRGHIHHRMLDRGFSQRQTVLVLYGASALLGVAAVLLVMVAPSQALVFLAALAALAFLALRRLGFFQLGKARRVIAARRRNLELLGHVRHARQAMRDARSPEELWMALRFGAWGLGATAVALRLPVARHADREPFAHGFDVKHELHVTRFGLDREGPGDTFVELGWHGRSRVDRDTEIAVEMLCGELAYSLSRLGVRTRRSLRVVDHRPGNAA